MRERIRESSAAQGEELARLYVQIRKDLERKILTLIYEVKTDPSKKRKLTAKARVSKRTIVEEALEEYFAKRDM